MENDTGARIVKRLADLKSLRQPHESVWRRCFEYTFPMRSSGFDGEVIDAASGQTKQADLLDSTGTESATVLASALMSGLTPANARWFMLDVTGADDAGKRWLDESADVIWRNIHASNYDAAGFESMLDMVVAGWFALYVDEDREKGGYTFEQWPISGIYCAFSKPGGMVDTVYRPYRLTAEQAVAEFGNEVSDKTKQLAKDTPDTKVNFVHCIEPRKGYKSGGKRSNELPIASYKVECDTKKVVKESGYHEMPVIVPRWQVIPDSTYAVGKVFDVLPDLQMLNKLKKTELASADLAVAGMWIAEDDGVLNPRTVKVGPRKIIIANSVDSMKPLQTGANFQLSEALVQQIQNAIRKQMMADQLTPRDGPALTATEVHANMMLLRQMMGPTFGRMQPEFLQRMIERCFGLAYRAGVLGRAPDSLAGRDFTVRYISPLARAQKLEDVAAIERLEANIAQVAQVRPEVLDLLDFDEGVRIKADALGVPERMVRDADTVAKQREANAQAQANAQNQAMTAPLLQKGGEKMIDAALAA